VAVRQPATSPTSSGLTMNDRMPFSDASGRRGEEEERHGILQLQAFEDVLHCFFTINPVDREIVSVECGTLGPPPL